MSQIFPPTVEATVFVYMDYDYDYDYTNGGKSWAPFFWRSKLEETPNRIFLCQAPLTLNLIGFNPVPGQVATIEQAKRDALAAYTKTVADLNEQLSKLLAITNDPSTQEPVYVP